MSEQDLEVLITLDDPGEDELEEDTFHNRKADKPAAVSENDDTVKRSSSPLRRFSS